VFEETTKKNAEAAQMAHAEVLPASHVRASSRRRSMRAPVRLVVAIAIVYLLVAYLVLPLAWARYEKRHPAIEDSPRITRTARGIPGDPLNVAFVGSQTELELALLAAGWVPADPITLKSTVKIAAGAVFHRSYVDAPVSNLFLWGRKQDLAFEQPAGKDPRRRHHVRFWRSERLDEAGRPLWIGAATFDTKVGFSHTTVQITHHIAADVDDERDKLMTDVKASGNLPEFYWVDGFHLTLQGKNGGGDKWHTDGRLAVGVLGPPPAAHASP
jgi:hypothetical protein